MPTVRMLNNLTGQYFEVEVVEPAPLPKPTEAELEAQYKARVAELIAEIYPPSREDGIKTEQMFAQANGEPCTQDFLNFCTYREACRDKARLEVYGI